MILNIWELKRKFCRKYKHTQNLNGEYEKRIITHLDKLYNKSTLQDTL